MTDQDNVLLARVDLINALSRVVDELAEARTELEAAMTYVCSAPEQREALRAAWRAVDRARTLATQAGR